ncbi:hypothetical protein [Portibacter marinus]|uniref:hypothetical protein n=1 Tax=Portibacter marinus TaxID=2898660 RepID=UPI001F172F0C|nr:hypothetical protein [Portibacter marinus]
MKLFKNNNTSTNELSIEHLKEEDTDYEVFIPWKNDYSGNNFFEWLKSRYDDFENCGIQNDKNIFFFKNESTTAFRLSTEILNISPSVVWNYWKDEIIDAGYALKNSETEYRGTKNTLRYYLKPKLKYKIEGEQLFGNITLELIKSGGKPTYIMLKCTWYSDSNFKAAKNFSELFRVLTN